MEDFKKIINVFQIRAADEFSIEKNAISSLELMENAAISFVNALEKQKITTKKIIVVCGSGNNGGDGLAVCRILKNRKIDASAVLLKFKETLSKDCEQNKNKLHTLTVLDSSSPLPDFSKYDVIIDAVFGSGLNRPVEGFVARIIDAINDAKKEVYSIDVPSGLSCDSLSASKHIVQSSHVISFQRPKLSFFFPENRPYIETWEVIDIGLDEFFIQEQDSNYFILDDNVSKHVKSRPRQSHKGTYGHALIIAGSYGKMGAAILSSKACLRSGVGLVTCNVPKCGYEIMQISVPESMCLTDESSKILTTLPDIEKFNAIGVGPGIGSDEQTISMLRKLLQKSVQPFVLDADAINILSAHHALLKLLPNNVILTPHVKEFDRLVGASKSTPERLKKQQAFSIKHKCIIILKDAYSCVSSPDGRQFFNTSGNQGMATAGSGDVLTGIITGLLAQKYEPLSAAIIGVYFHGKAGDKGVLKRSFSSLIASDIIENLSIERY